jgi:hypothetical protein
MNQNNFELEGGTYDMNTGVGSQEDFMGSDLHSIALNLNQELNQDLNHDLHSGLNHEMPNGNNVDYSGFLDSQMNSSYLFDTEDQSYLTHMGNGGMINYNLHNIPNHNNFIDNNYIQNNNNRVFAGELEENSYGTQNFQFSLLEGGTARRTNTSDVILNNRRVRFGTSAPVQNNDKEFNVIVASIKKTLEPFNLKKRIFPKFIAFLTSYFEKLIFHINKYAKIKLNKLAEISNTFKEKIKLDHLSKYSDNPISFYFCQHIPMTDISDIDVNKENLDLISSINQNQLEYEELYINFRKTMRDWLNDYINSPEFNSDLNKAVHKFYCLRKVKEQSFDMKVRLEEKFRSLYLLRAHNILND